MSMTQSTVDTVRTPPLCVELDGVVILSNSLYETLLALIVVNLWLKTLEGRLRLPAAGSRFPSIGHSRIWRLDAMVAGGMEESAAKNDGVVDISKHHGDYQQRQERAGNQAANHDNCHW